MSTARTANLLGALVVALGDEIESAAAPVVDHGAAFPAALVSIHSTPGLSISALCQILGLSHSGTVRLLDCLEKDGSVERKAGRDARSVALQLTTMGRRQVRDILAARRTVLDQALTALSGAEQAQLERLTSKLLAGLTRDQAHANHICRMCDEASCPDATCPLVCAAQGANA